MTTTADGDPLPPSHDRRVCRRCRDGGVHVTIEHAPNVDRVTVFRVVGIMPEARAGAGWTLTFWTGHEWTIARRVLSEVADLVHAAELGGYRRGLTDADLASGRVKAGILSALRGEAGREVARLRGNVDPALVLFHGPAAPPPRPPTPPTPPTWPEEVRVRVNVKPGRPEVGDVWGAWWRGILRALRPGRRSRRPS